VSQSLSQRLRAVPGVVAAALLALGACHSLQPRSPRAAEAWSGFGNLENVLRWTPEQQLRGYRNIDRIYPTRPVAASPHPFPLPDTPVDFSALRYTAGAGTSDINAFVSHNHIVGLLAIRDGNVVLERYAQGNTRDTRWYSFSVAKSVVSMLVGAAVKDGFISSIDVPVSNFLPVLRGSAYDDATLRQAMTMSSGVAWNEDYADPQSDIAQTGGSALDRLRYLLRKQRVAAPGSTFNYNTEETNLVGAVLRAAIGNNLATYLEDKIWRRFGMEQENVDHLISCQRSLRHAVVAPPGSCVCRRRHIRTGHLHQSTLPPGDRHSQRVVARHRSRTVGAPRGVLRRDGEVGGGG